MSASYDKVPSAAKFKSDSSKIGLFRSDDAILSYIDLTLADFDKEGDGTPAGLLALSEIMFACNNWMKEYNRSPNDSNAKRRDSILKLFEIVVKTIAGLLGVGKGRSGLPNQAMLDETLSDIFGIPLTDLGARIDKRYHGQFLSPAERNFSRIRIAKGLLYHYKWSGLSLKLELLDSTDYEDPLAGKQDSPATKGSAPFVMSMEREFYMTRHHVFGKVCDPFGTLHTDSVFHSTYFRDKKISAAGTLVVQNGKLISVRGDSGHYMPADDYIAHALRGFASQGVAMGGVKVFGYQTPTYNERAAQSSMKGDVRKIDALMTSRRDANLDKRSARAMQQEYGAATAATQVLNGH